MEKNIVIGSTAFDRIIKNDKYTTFVSHDFHDIDLATKYFDKIIEYPKYTLNNTYIYKSLESKQCETLNKCELIDESHFSLSGSGKTLKLNYNEIPETVEARFIIYDANNKQKKEGKLVFPKGKKSIFLDISAFGEFSQIIYVQSQMNISIFEVADK